MSPSTGNIFDSRSECSSQQALNTGEGVRGFHGHHPTDAVTRPQERGISDSQISSEGGDGYRADLEELAEQYRLEEEDDAEEGALIEASRYPDPAYERNGR